MKKLSPKALHKKQCRFKLLRNLDAGDLIAYKEYGRSSTFVFFVVVRCVQRSDDIVYNDTYEYTSAVRNICALYVINRYGRLVHLSVNLSSKIRVVVKHPRSQSAKSS